MMVNNIHCTTKLSTNKSTWTHAIYNSISMTSSHEKLLKQIFSLLHSAKFSTSMALSPQNFKSSFVKDWISIFTSINYAKYNYSWFFRILLFLICLFSITVFVNTFCTCISTTVLDIHRFDTLIFLDLHLCMVQSVHHTIHNNIFINTKIVLNVRKYIFEHFPCCCPC